MLIEEKQSPKSKKASSNPHSSIYGGGSKNATFLKSSKSKILFQNFLKRDKEEIRKKNSQYSFLNKDSS
jgi:hypothetical protein